MKEGEDVDISRYKKRSRARSAINEKKQCRAKRADGKQCSRARREGEDYCGTHIKGCPHGRYKTKEDDKEDKHHLSKILHRDSKYRTFSRFLDTISVFLYQGSVFYAQLTLATSE